MHKLLATIVVLSICNISLAQEKVKRAEYMLERLTIHTGLSLPKYIASCFWPRNPCGVTDPKVGDALNKIVQTAGNFPVIPTLIWEHESNGMFNRGNASHRLAVTQLKPESPIYINKDLAINKETGEIISQADLISILVHEYGHHAGYQDTEDRILDRVSALIKRRFLQMSQTITLETLGYKNLKRNVYNAFPLNDLKTMPQRDMRRFNTVSFLGNDFRHSPIRLQNEGDIDPTDRNKNFLMKYILKKFSKVCKTEDYVQIIHADNLRWSNLPARDESLEGKNVESTIDLKIFCGKDFQNLTEINAKQKHHATLQTINGEMALIRPSFITVSSQEEDRSQDLQLTSVISNTNKITDGGVWKNIATVKVPSGLEIKNCTAILGSGQFTQYWSAKPYKYRIDNCSVTKIDNKTTQLNFDYNVDENFSSSKVHITEITVLVKKKNGEEVYETLYPQLRPELTIINSVKDPFYTLDSVQVLDDHENQIMSIDQSTYDYLNRKLTFVLNFSSCYEHFNVDLLTFDLEFDREDQMMGMLPYFINTDDSLFTMGSIVEEESICVENKRTVRYSFVMNYGQLNQNILSYFQRENITKVRLKRVYFTSKDHRVFNYNFDSFSITVEAQ